MKKNYTNVNSVLGKILNQYHLNHLYSLENIRQKWGTFDKTIAAHAHPVGYDDTYKKLTLKVSNTSWKKEFINNRDVLRVKIQNAFQDIDIKNIEII